MATTGPSLKESKRGNPAGTRFAVITLAALLVLVGIYFVITHVGELESSPMSENSPTMAERLQNPAASR